jgi:hypothetical protein
MQYPPTKIFLENAKKRERITKKRERRERKYINSCYASPASLILRNSLFSCPVRDKMLVEKRYIKNTRPVRDEMLVKSSNHN